MSILKVNTIQDKGGNNLLVSDGAGTISSSGAITNTPAFHAYLATASQSIADDTDTLIQYNATTLDTNNAFNTSTYRFTPAVSGKYFLYAQGNMYASAKMMLHIRKNGTRIFTGRDRGGGNTFDQTVASNGIIEANTTDYFDVTFYQDSNGALNLAGNDVFKTFFGGYRIIGA